MLFQQVLILQKIEMEGALRIQVICVTGTCVISKSTYGFSRGIITEGVISVEDMLSFVPLHLSALKFSDKLLEWINSWWVQGGEVPLMPEDWFKKGQVINVRFTKSEWYKIPVTIEQISSYGYQLMLRVA